MSDGLRIHVNQVHVSAVPPTPTFQTRDRIRVIVATTRLPGLRPMATGQLPEQFRSLTTQ